MWVKDFSLDDFCRTIMNHEVVLFSEWFPFPRHTWIYNEKCVVFQILLARDVLYEPRNFRKNVWILSDQYSVVKNNLKETNIAVPVLFLRFELSFVKHVQIRIYLFCVLYFSSESIIWTRLCPDKFVRLHGSEKSPDRIPYLFPIAVVLCSCTLAFLLILLKKGPTSLLPALAKSGFTAAFSLIFVSEIGDKV